MIGFRVAEPVARVDPALVARARAVPVSCVSDCMSRMFGMGAAIRPLHGGGASLAGPAITVRARPGDNLMLHKAIDMAQPGDVIVVDGGGDLAHALIGAMMLTNAITRGVAGLVINGAVRDLSWIAGQAMPVFAVGVSHRGPLKDGPGEVNFPIAINGTVIMPGDLVLGDADGVVAVARADAPAVIDAAEKKHAAETKTLQSGNPKQHGWIDAQLLEQGCALP